jgi:hypothetical protein
MSGSSSGVLAGQKKARLGRRPGRTQNFRASTSARTLLGSKSLQRRGVDDAGQALPHQGGFSARPRPFPLHGASFYGTSLRIRAVFGRDGFRFRHARGQFRGVDDADQHITLAQVTCRRDRDLRAVGRGLAVGIERGIGEQAAIRPQVHESASVHTNLRFAVLGQGFAEKAAAGVPAQRGAAETGRDSKFAEFGFAAERFVDSPSHIGVCTADGATLAGASHAGMLPRLPTCGAGVSRGARCGPKFWRDGDRRKITYPL